MLLLYAKFKVNKMINIRVDVNLLGGFIKIGANGCGIDEVAASEPTSFPYYKFSGWKTVSQTTMQPSCVYRVMHRFFVHSSFENEYLSDVKVVLDSLQGIKIVLGNP